MSYPAQLKMLIDRMGSLMKLTKTGEVQTVLKGKTLALLATGSGGLNNKPEEQTFGSTEGTRLRRNTGFCVGKGGLVAQSTGFVGIRISGYNS